MISSGINLVMTVIGFTVSAMFIVFVCTRLICARIQLNTSRRSFPMASGSDTSSVLERALHGMEPLVVANFPTRKYRDLCLSSKENVQCSVCLSEYHQEDTLRFLPLCGHSFHASCIDIWLQQHSTCPVCRVSLRERKWFMQPMFSSAIRYPHFTTQSLNTHSCHCMTNGLSHPSLSHENQLTNHSIQDNHCQPHEANPITIDHDGACKESVNRKLETPSSR